MSAFARVRTHVEAVLLVVAVTLLAAGGVLYITGFDAAVHGSWAIDTLGRRRGGHVVGDRRGPTPDNGAPDLLPHPTEDAIATVADALEPRTELGGS